MHVDLGDSFGSQSLLVELHKDVFAVLHIFVKNTIQIRYNNKKEQKYSLKILRQINGIIEVSLAQNGWFID